MDRVISNIQSSFNPLHTNLGERTSRPLHIIGQLINDPSHTFDELRHHRHSRDRSGSGGEPVYSPDFDVRESENYYFLEGEFPGLKDKEDILIEWVGRRELNIEARVPKLDEEAEWGIVLGPPAGRENEEDYEADVESADRRQRERDRSHHGDKRRHRDGLRELMSNRKTGQFRQSFSFPVEVEQDSLRVRLSHGLLKILVPKVKPEDREPRRRIFIED